MTTLVLVKNVFTPQDCREVKQIEPGCTVADLLEQYAIDGVDLEATVNGESADATTKVCDEDFVVIHPVIAGGGDKGGKGIIGIIAAIALSVVSFGIASGGWLAGLGKAFGAGMWGAYAAATAVMFLGSMLMGRLSGQKADVGAYEEKDQPTYSWGEVRTMEGQNNPIALTYGTVKSGGQTIAKYVNIDDDNDEYLNWLVAAGEGPLTFTEIKLNENDYGNYDDVSVTTRPGENNQAIISEFGDTYATKNLNYRLSDSWTSDSAQGSDTRGLIFTIEFPSGLYHFTNKGELSTAWVTLDIEYKIADGSWTNLFKEVSSNNYGIQLRKNVSAGSYPFTITGNMWDTGSDSGEEVLVFYDCTIKIGDDSADASKSQVNNGNTVNVGSFSVDISAWSDTIKNSIKNGGSYSGTITVSDGTGVGLISDKSRSAVRKQFRINKVPAGVYDVRVKVANRQYPEDDSQSCSICYWTAITSVIYDDFIYPCTALIGITAKATDQLSGAPSLTFLKQRKKVWVWNSSAGEYQEKNATNPAWACYDLLHQARKLHDINTDTDVMEVRGVPAARMRYMDFYRWATWCNEKNLKVNIEINTTGEVLDVANQRIAPIGRGMVVRFGTNYGCIYDHAQDPVQMFGMGNIVSGTFTEEFLKVADRANCVEVTFTNAAADYQRDVLTIYGDTFNSDGYAKTAQLTMDGITSYEQAYREGMYQLMCNKYQLRTVSFEADIDAIACTVGDVALVAHDVPKWAYSGRIEGVDGNTLRLPCYVTDLTKSYRIQYRTVNDNIYTKPCTIVSSTEDGWTTVSLSDTENMPQVGDVFDLAIANIGSKPFIIKNITRSQEFRRKITAVEYSEALYNEDYDIPPIQYSMLENNRARNVTKLSAAQYQYTDANGVKHGVMDVSWKKPSNGGKFTISISTNGKKWETKVSGTENNSVEFEVKAKTRYYVRVVTVLGLRQSSGVTIGLIDYGEDVPPTAVTGVTYKIDPADRTKAELSWNSNTDIDFKYYEVVVSGGKTYTTAANIMTLISEQDNPTVTIRSVDNAGNKSTAVSIVVPIVNHPSDVTGFAVTQQTTDKSVLEFTWDAVTDSDLSQYELRVGGVQFAKTKTRKTTYQVASSGSYTFTIYAINAAGNYSVNAATITQTINIIPSTVTGLALQQRTTDKSIIDITWNAVSDSDLSFYEVRVGDNWESGTQIAQTKSLTTSYKLPSGGNYSFYVKAVNASGNYSADAATVTRSFNVIPSTVTGLALQQRITDRSIVDLTWNAVTDEDLSYYEVRVGNSWDGGTQVAKTKSLTASYQLPSSGSYKFFVVAVNVAEFQSEPALLQQQLTVEPNAVTNLTITQSTKDHSKAIIKFNPSAGEDIAKYVIKYGNAWASGTTIISTKETQVEWQVPASGTYNIMVQAVTVGGFGSAITNGSITITIEPMDVTNFHATQSTVNKTSIMLSWDVVNQTDIAYYIIKSGSSWDSGTIVAPRVSGTSYEVLIDQERIYTWMIKAVTIAGNESQYAASTSEIFGLNPTAVSQIQLRQNPQDRSQLQIQWTGVSDGDLVGYQVKVGDVWESAEELPLTNELYANYTLARTQSVHVMIKSLNSAGFYSDEASANLYCTVEPTNCTNFVAYQDGESVELYWTVSTDVDVTGYEIREGSYFDVGALVATGVTNNYLIVPVDMERLYQYHIVAINKAGFKSISALTARVNVIDLPPKNVIQTFDEIARQSGTHNNTEFGESLINFQTVGGRFSDYPTTRFSDLGGQEVLKLKLNTTTNRYPTSGTYTLRRIDIGTIITAQLAVYFTPSVMYTGGTSALLEFRTSLDATNWIDWMEFKPIQRRFRYIEFRVTLGTTDTTKTPGVNHLLIQIDVPDTDIAITASIAASGTTVPYGHTFYTVPNVTANAIGETVHASVISRSTTSCVIKVFNTSNTAVAGTADIKIKGY